MLANWATDSATSTVSLYELVCALQVICVLSSVLDPRLTHGQILPQAGGLRLEPVVLCTDERCVCRMPAYTTRTTTISFTACTSTRHRHMGYLPNHNSHCLVPKQTHQRAMLRRQELMISWQLKARRLGVGPLLRARVATCCYCLVSSPL